MNHVKTFERYGTPTIYFNVNEDAGTITINKNESIAEIVIEDLDNLIDIMIGEITKYKMSHDTQIVTAWKSNETLVIQVDSKNMDLTQHFELDNNEQNMLIDAIDDLFNNVKK
jgi:hypothetical protein